MNTRDPTIARAADGGIQPANSAPVNEATAKSGTRSLEQVARSDALLATIFERAPGGIAIRDLTQRFIRVNPAFARLSGYSEAELLGLTERDLTHPEDWPDNQAKLEALLARESDQFTIEKRYVHKSGGKIWVRNTVALATNEQGLPNYFIAQVEDITLRKLVQDALRESESRFRGLTALSSDWYWEQDENLRFTFVTASAEGRAAIPTPDIIGRTRLELPFEWPSEDERRQHLTLLEQRKPFRSLLLRSAESGRYVLTSGEPVFDASGRFAGYRGVATDMTQYKLAERALRESEERFRSLTQLSSDWYWEQDSELRFTFVSHGNARHLLGGSAGYIGRRRWEIPTVGLTEAQWAQHRALLAAHQPFRDFEYGIELTDGEVAWLRVSGEPIFDENKQFRGYRGIGCDVTERKRAEAALRESDERFRRGFNDAAIGMALVSLDGRFLAVNRSLCEIVGYTEPELLARTFQEITHPDDLEADLAQARKLFAGEIRAYHMEKRYIRKDGQFVWVLLSGSVVRSADGMPLYALAQMQDISRRKMAEQELAASETRFRALTEMSSDWYWEQDADFRMTFLSDGFEKATGIPSERVLGIHRWDARTLGLSADDWEQHKAVLKAHKPFHNLEFGYVRRDGAVRYLQVSGEPVFDQKNSLIGYRGIGLDVTERRHAQQRIKESEARLQAFMNNSPSVMFIKDLDGRYVHLNERFARAIGREMKDVLSKTDAEIFPPEVAAQLRTNDLRAQASGSAIESEESVPYTDGMHTSIVSKFPLFDADGRVSAVGGIATDITERKNTEQAIARSEAMLRGILENLPVGIWVADEKGNIVLWNPAAEKIWGGARPVGIEQYGQYKIWWSGTDREIGIHERAMARAVERGETSLSELIDIEGFDGVRRTILNSGVPLRDADGQITGGIVLNEDVTARRHVEEALVNIAAGVSAATGDEYFRLLVDRLARAVSAECAFIGAVNADEPEKVTAVSAVVDGEFIESFSYDFRGTPCEDVVFKKSVVHSNSARSDFSRTPLLDRVAGQSYIGAPLLNSAGNVLGLMIVISRKPIENPEFVKFVLRILASRAAAELERKRAEEVIRSLLKVGEKLYGAQDIEALIESIAAQSAHLVRAERALAVLVENGEIGLMRQSVPKERTQSGRGKRRLHEACAWVLANKKPYLENGIVPGEKTGTSVGRARKTRSLLCVPIVDAGDEILGIIELDKKRGSAGFGEDDVNALIGLSRIAAIAIQKMLAYDKVQQAEARLTESEERLRALAVRLQGVIEEERTRIAREIHDELGQALTGLKMDLSWLERKVGPKNRTAVAQIRSISKFTNDLIQTVRKISTNLRPGELDDLGLVAAIESQSQDFQLRTGIQCRLRLPESDIKVDPEIATATFRICQELLTNVARHADASLVDVGLHDEGDWLTLWVRDNGRGIRPNEISGRKAIGIIGMRERAMMFGGSISLEGTAGHGTVATVRMPLAGITEIARFQHSPGKIGASRLPARKRSR